MSKSDFEFYRFGNTPIDFVRPAPASDPYNGAYDLAAIPELSIRYLENIVAATIGAAAVKEVAYKPYKFKGYFFDKYSYGTDLVIAQKAMIHAPLEVEDDYWSLPFQELEKELGLSSAEFEHAFHFTPRDTTKERNTIVTCREIGGLNARTELLDEDEVPVNPSLRIRQLTHLRAFRWLAGPERKSSIRGVLPPTYSPRPAHVCVQQIVDVIGLNPLVEQSVKSPSAV